MLMSPQNFNLNNLLQDTIINSLKSETRVNFKISNRKKNLTLSDPHTPTIRRFIGSFLSRNLTGQEESEMIYSKYRKEK